jgi:hypothetical protein
MCCFQVLFLLFLQEPPIIPVTFVTSQSFAKLRGYEGVNSLNVSFSFRTYEGDGLLLYHKFTSEGYVKVLIVISCYVVHTTVLNPDIFYLTNSTCNSNFLSFAVVTVV